MHFTAMLAFSLLVLVSYYWPTVLLSCVTAALSAALALYVVSRTEMRNARAMSSGVLMGCGIAALRYMDSGAMRMTADCSANSLLVACDAPAFARCT